LKLPLFLLLALFALAAFPLAAQEEQEAEAPPEAALETEVQDVGDDLLYVIAAFEFDIKGRTRPFALIYNGEFKIGETIKGQENLAKYIRDKTQKLINQRVLKDNAVITHSVGEQAEDGSYPVTFSIKVEDSWNIIALPKPEYNTNTGFDLTIKARDYNFLGTMNPLRVDLGYQYDENKQHSFIIGVFSDTPFTAFGYRWNIKFDNILSYRQDTEEPFYYQNVIGVSMELPVKTTTFTFGFEESINLNEENSDRNKIAYGEKIGNRLYYGKDYQTGLYMSSRLFTSWKIPTGLIVSKFGELTYTPNVSARFNHEMPHESPEWPLQEFLKGPFLGFGHSLNFEKIDWYANYRDGLSVSANNSYSYDFNSKDPLSASLNVHGIGHFIISDFFAISTRLMYRYWFYHKPEYYTEASNALRGISDKRISANHMLSLNMDFPFRILNFVPSKWFNTSKLSFFDLELQIAPVIDLAMYQGELVYTKRASGRSYRETEKKVSFHPKNIAATGGLELIVFSEFMRNLYIRLGFAWNLREFSTKKSFFPSGENREIYLIMGHFY